MSTESAREKEERDLEHYRKAQNEEVQRPSLKPIAFALAISTTLNHRPAQVPQVPVEPLFPQHGDECGEQGGQKTCVHEASGRDDLVWWSLGKRNDGGLAWDRGMIESEEDGAKEGHGLLVRVRPELRMDVDDERRADGREQTGLREQVREATRVNNRRRTKIKVVLRSSSYFLT